MRLTVLGSSSAGNGYILHDEQEALILECGIKFQEVQKVLDFNTDKVVAALVSHEHGDHCKYITEYQYKAIDIYASAGTFGAIKGVSFQAKNILKHGEVKKIGNFTLIPFNLKHDCAEPLGFYLHHPKTGNILFATDTYYLEATFSDVRHWLIECNYRKDILDRNCPESSGMKRLLRNRTLQSHMSFETCKKTLLANDLTLTESIVLIHLSDSNSHARDFKRDIERATGKPVYIAEKGLEMDLNIF